MIVITNSVNDHIKESCTSWNCKREDQEMKELRVLGRGRIKENGLSKQGIREIELTFQLAKNICNKLLLNGVRSASLYAAEILEVTGKGGLDDIRKKERKILTKIPSPKMRLTPNKEMYPKRVGVVEQIHLQVNNRNMLTKRILKFFRLRKTGPKWFLEVKIDLNHQRG